MSSHPQTSGTHTRLIIILGLEIVPWTGEKIGSPVTLENAEPAAPAPAPAHDMKPAVGNASNRPVSNARQPPARAPGGRKDMGPIFPIEGLSPYQNKCVFSKSPR